MLPVRLKIEGTINSLLDKALPNDFQKFKIYKHLANYYDYKEDYLFFKSRLFEFYDIPKKKRCDKKASSIFNIIISVYDYQILALGFHNSLIKDHDFFTKATDLKWIITENFKLPVEITTTDIIMASLLNFNKPSTEKSFEVDCEEFLDSWKQICFTRFGNKYEKYIDGIYPLISKEKSKFEIDIKAKGGPDAGNTVQLTQTQINWIKMVKKGIEKGKELAEHPVMTPINIPRLAEFNRHVMGYNYLYNQNNPQNWERMQKLANSLDQMCNELLNMNREENLWNVTNRSRES